ncbi:MAG: UDP-N-acetylmuramoyl-tripeptide--D-alanyl-D-alanine ligase [Bacteroidota bacterium]
MRITLNDIFNLSGSVIYNPDSFKAVTSVSIDTRTIKKNSLFVAIKGEKFDGHQFVNEAVKQGASALLISNKKLKQFDHLDLPIITVPNTTIAYGELAHIWRMKLNSKVISITGSNGKTTTKEILATLLSEKYKTEKTVANNNNHIGVPLTLFATKSSCEVLILEHGTNHFEEIKYTAQIASPDYSLITNIGDSHLEYLIDREGVYREKSALFDSTVESNGTLFINNDDQIIRKNSKKSNTKVTYGFRGQCDVKGKIVGYTKDGRTILSVNYKGKSIEVTLPIFGKSNAQNVLAAIAIAQFLKLSTRQIKSGVGKLEQIKGRLSTEFLNGLILIDDTYNSNPSSMETAIDLLKRIKKHKTKTLILGDMFELGEKSVEYHKNLHILISKSKIQNVLLLGKMMSSLDKKLKKAKINSTHFSNRLGLKSYINKSDLTNQVVLVKGSRGMRMEDFVKQIREQAA